MRLSLLIALCLASGCLHVDRATLVASTAVLACDWMDTRKMAANDWMGGRFHEANAIMGPSPSTSTVDAYFLATGVINVALWAILPKGWRSAVPSAVTAVQVKTIVDNAPQTGWCGVGGARPRPTF